MKRRAVVLAALGVVACGGGNVVVAPATIEAVSGADRQSAPAGGMLPRPLAVTVRQADGSAAARAQVRWTLTGGSGAVLSDSVTLADGEGQAQVTLRLGTQEGAYAVRAELVQVAGKAVAFGATATAPPGITAVVPSSFTGGDTITLEGSGFAVDAAVAVGNKPARVLATAGDTALTVTAPVCLPAGSVAVQALGRVQTARALSALVPVAQRAAPKLHDAHGVPARALALRGAHVPGRRLPAGPPGGACHNFTVRCASSIAG